MTTVITSTPASSINHIGLIGLGTMGYHLAQNFAHHGITISVYNRSPDKTDQLAELALPTVQPTYSLSQLVESLPTPRYIHLMIDDSAIDDVVYELIPLLAAGDCIIDCGNTHWTATERRQKQLTEKEIHYIGCGISGGYQGALTGPSMMPSGDPYIVATLLPLYQTIAAKDFKNQPCVTAIGTGGSGHFVKMVHNGIEYALMGAIAEIYGYLRSQNYTLSEIQDVVEALNTGRLTSYLLEITSTILAQELSQNANSIHDKLDMISPHVTSNNTGKWTVQAALDLQVPIPSIAAAVFMRYSSLQQDLLSVDTYDHIESLDIHNYDTPSSLDLSIALEKIFETIYLQGLELIAHANKTYNWNINLAEILRIWQGGCIIHSQILEDFIPTLSSQDPTVGLAEIHSLSQLAQTPLPVIRATLDYSLTHTTSLDFMSLIQAQRYYFGRHPYTLKSL